MRVRSRARASKMSRVAFRRKENSRRAEGGAEGGGLGARPGMEGDIVGM